ncbi:MAG: endo-1,4-beta-xylanase [candidate division KSB1 bacterium]|nr:endo-1,4-beta-xylanase [candidate division KSB1 bacterium]
MVLLVLWLRSAKDAKVTLQYDNQATPATNSLKAVVRLSPQWQFILLPFKAQTSGNGYFKILPIEPADTLFISAPAALNYEKSYRIYDLPVECPGLYYEGRESSASWREEALNRIEQIRRGQISLKVCDANGRPAIGAKIRYSMIRHCFGFGTAVSVFPWLQPSRDGEIYLRKLSDLDGQGHGFNTIVLENALKWVPWEDDRLHGSRKEVVEIINWLRNKGFMLRGHNLLWPSWSAMPKDMQEHRADRNYLSNRIKAHISELLGYPGINGRIEEWDVLNEPLWCRDLEFAMGSDSIYASVFRWAKEKDPAAKLYINVNEILSAGGYDAALYKRFLDLLDRLDRSGAKVHGVGIQGHVKYELVPPKRWLEIFDDLAARGKEISITEFDAVNIPEETAADYLRDLLITCYSHPAVKNFIMWGFWDGAHWQKDAPIFYSDWSLKPSGRVFMDYVFQRWRSEGEGVCDKTGQWSGRLYYGQYQVTVAYGGCLQQTVIDFKPNSGTFFVELEPDTSPPENPKGLTLLRR